MADDLDRLAADLGKAAREIGTKIGTAVRSSSEQVRDDWRVQVRRSTGRRLRHFPASITSETRAGNGWVEGVIGPDKDKRQGALGNIVEFGTSRHGPIAPARDAVTDAEAPRFERAVLDSTEGLL